MCNNQTNAAPETHATLTATLVVASGSVFVPDTKTTSTKNYSSSSTSIVVTTSATSSATPSSTLATSTSSSATSIATTGTTTTSTPTSTAIASSTSLSRAQVGGIAGGVAAAAVLAALLALFIFLRRRRNNGSGGGFSRMRDSWSPKRVQHLQGSPGSIPAISAPKYEEPKVMSFTRALAKRVSRQSRFGGGNATASRRPGTIGLAISPAGASMPQRMTRWPGDGGLTAGSVTPAWTPPAPVVRRYSPEPSAVPTMSPGRAVSSFNFFPQSPPQPPNDQSLQQQQPLLSPPQPTYTNNHPQRPNLTVAIPPPKLKRASTSSTSNRLPLVTINGRDSIVTEFAEDGEDMTSSALGSAQIWRPPNTDPHSATTYYVADKWGNWVLGSGSAPPEELAELETPISKTVKERETEVTRQQKKHQQQEEEERHRLRKHAATTTQDKEVVKDSEAVKAAMRHLSSPTIPESVALKNLGNVASGSVKPSGNSSSSGAALLKPTIRLVTPESGRLPINSRSSSVYSHASVPQKVAPGMENPMPVPGGAVTVSKRASRLLPPNPADLGVHPALRGEHGDHDSVMAKSTRRRSNSGNEFQNNGGRRERSQTMMSQDSATTIASSVGESVDIDDFPTPSRHASYATQRQSSYPVDLSPVIESPGRSPVSYPQIPRSRSSAQMYVATASKPQPPQTATAAMGSEQQRPMNAAIRRVQGNIMGQSSSSDSPTLGMIGSQRPQMEPSLVPTTKPSEGHISHYNPTRSSSLNPNLNPNPYRNPGSVRSGSPNMVGPDELMIRKKQQQQRYQEAPQAVSQSSSSSSRNNYSGQHQQQTRQFSQEAPHPQSFQTRINNRSQLPSQTHSRYGPSSVYDAYNDPASRPESHLTSATPVASSYQPFQTQTSFSPPPPPPTTFTLLSPPSSTEPAQQQQRDRDFSNNTVIIRSPSPEKEVVVVSQAAAATPSPAGSTTSNGSSSSLLAKRLGPERAAAFQVPVNLAQRKWARRKSSLTAGSTTHRTLTTTNTTAISSPPSSAGAYPQPLAPKGVVVRKVARMDDKENTYHPQQYNNDSGRVDYEGQGYEEEIEVQFLPATPGWKPQLTPKRRGGDLYLSVQ